MKDINDMQAMQALLDGDRIVANDPRAVSLWYEMRADGLLYNDKDQRCTLSFGQEFQYGWDIVSREYTFMEALKRPGRYMSVEEPGVARYLMTVYRFAINSCEYSGIQIHIFTFNCKSLTGAHTCKSQYTS